MPTGRFAFTVAVVNNTIYAIGGNTGSQKAVGTVEAFDPAANGGAGAWTSKTDMTTPRFGLTSQVVNGIIYAIGGKNGSGTVVPTVEAFDPAGNGGAGAWAAKTDMGTARFGLTSQVVNGIIYAISGEAVTENTVEAFDPTGIGGMGSWTAVTNAMTTARVELTAQTVNQLVYAIGGDSSCTGLAATEAFDPTGNGGAGAWSTLPDMPTARKALASAAVNGIVYVIGGISSCDGGTILKTVEAFDPAGNSGAGAWGTRADMPTARQSLSSAQVNGTVYAIGGNDDAGTVFKTVEAYTPGPGCGDAATCLATFSDAFAGASDAIGSALSGGSSSLGCFAWTNTFNSPPNINFTMLFNNCPIVSGSDTITVNGNLTIASTATQYSFSSTGFSVVGTANGKAVDFSCSMNVTYVFSPLSISGTICGTNFAPPPAPTGVSAIIPALTCGTVSLTWDPSPDTMVTTYNVYWLITPGVTVSVSNNQTPVSAAGLTFPYSLTALGNVPNTIYVILTAVNPAGEGPPSAEVSATLPNCT